MSSRGIGGSAMRRGRRYRDSVVIGAEGPDRARGAPLDSHRSEPPTSWPCGQERVIFHVEDARGVVGALDEGAEAEKRKASSCSMVPNRRRGRGAALLHPIEEARNPQRFRPSKSSPAPGARSSQAFQASLEIAVR